MKTFIYKKPDGMIKEMPIIYDSGIIKRDLIMVDKARCEESCKARCGCYGKKGSCPPYSPILSKLYAKEDSLFVYYIGVDNELLLKLKNSIGIYKTLGVLNTILAHMAMRIGRSLNDTMRFLACGTCKICAGGGKCNYRIGIHVCKHPDRRRYSLESTGVIVDSITKPLFGFELDWYKSGHMPRQIIQLGGVLCTNEDYQLKFEEAIKREELRNVQPNN